MSRHLALVLAVALAFVATPTYGQNLRAGVKGGVDFANLGGDAEDALDSSLKVKTGFSAGGFFGVDLHRLFRVQVEGQYVQKGAKAEEAGVELKAKLDYAEVMVPLTLLIPVENGAIMPRLYAGPALGFEMSCKLSGEEGGVSVDVDCKDTGIETKSIDFGVFVGAGADFAVGAGAITIDVLYNLGLSNINDVPDTVEDVLNRNIQILAGYAFTFGG